MPKNDLRAPNNERAHDMYEYYRQNHTMDEVGAHFGVTKQRVSEILIRNGYKISSRSLQFPRHGKAILEFISQYRGQHNISPTTKEIAEAVLGNPVYRGNVSDYVQRLIDLGYLYRAQEGNASRVLMLTQPQPPLPERVK